MTSSDPWQIKGAQPGTGDAAPPAAETSALEPRSGESRSGESRSTPRSAPEESLAAVNERLESLSQQIDQLASLNARSQRLPGEARDEEAARLVASAMSGLNRRLDELIVGRRPRPPQEPIRATRAYRALAHERAMPHPLSAAPTNSLDQALVEIAERQRALDAESALRNDFLRAPTQDFRDLESQLRILTHEIETLRPCGIDKAIEALRDDLAEIGGMIKEAMPRQAVEALEKEVRALSERIQNERQAGADAGVLSGVERGLAEVRDALRALTPAENLRGFDEAVQSLSQKIDRIAISSHDPAAIGQLESAMVGLRSIVAHVASNDALAKLSEDVRKLSVKVEEAATPPGFFINLERRLATIADALEGRHQEDAAAMALRSGDALGGDRGPARADGAATQQLEMRISQLVEKLDAADTRLNHLETIERGVSELLARFDQERTAPKPEGEAPEVMLLKRDVRRTQDSLEAVHGTLGHVVDRLAVIETGIRGGGPGGQHPSGPDIDPPAPSGKSYAGPTGPESLLSNASLVLQTAPSVTSASERSAMARHSFAIGESFDIQPTAHGKPPAGSQPSSLTSTAGPERRAIDASLPPDHPLEPGLGALRGNSPADRIAASEAALGSAKPASDAEPSGRANFIAAARRAAQAAGGSETAQRNSDRRTTASDAKAIRSGERETASWFSKHVRSLLAGASVILLVAGGVYLATAPFGASWDGPETIAGSRNTEPVLASAASIPVPVSSKDDSLSGRTGAPFGTPASGMILPFDPASSPAGSFASADAEPRSTGSVRASALASRPADPASMPETATTQRSLAERLPVGIGGNLRTAAVKGDPAAQYEVALRLAEGRGVPQDLPSAVEWFTRAADQGLAPAQFRLGGLYEKGSGVKKDLESARRLYTAAGQAGNAKAMHNMAVLYAEGVDGKSDYQSAAKWFRKAADYGVQDSQYNLGILYARGIGVEVNLSEAYKWFTLAARDGDKDSIKKRDDVGARLDQASLTAARNAAQIWVAEQQPETAVQVKGPAGGWDKVGVANAKRTGSKS